MAERTLKTGYPEEVIAISSKGKKEARVLVEKGSYIRYTYKDPASGKLMQPGKETVLLKSEKGECEQLFIVPISSGRNLLFKTKNPKKKKVLDEKSKKIVSLQD